MKQSINLSQFRDAFRDMERSDNFSYEGLEALYNFITELDEDCGTETELDVIGLCCEFTEYDNFYQAREAYNLEDWETLEDHTLVLYSGNYGSSSSVILHNF